MCGINGYLQFSKFRNENQISDLISGMNNCIKHRGPDDEGLLVKQNVGIGMRRLSIIDLKTGNQPIFNEDNSLAIILNGEIYNYETLRNDLLAKGHCFRTTSDTEVIIHCFEEYNVECFNKLKGMFALAIYDFNKNSLIIARDRAGEKPLYYHKNQDFFVFASELKSINNSNLIQKKISKKALNQYLQLTYIPAPLTIFDEIYKLKAGHYMIIEADGKMTIEQYWDVNFNRGELITDFEQCKKELRKTLFNAVEECMVSDVPIGAFLSGGIDSTIIVGIMSKISGSPINTFTIGYKEGQYDESGRANISAKLHNTNHRVYHLNYENAWLELTKILMNIDEPFADSSLIPTYMVSKFSSQYVKTVLTGDAGDELFGGYNKYLIGYYSEKYNKIPDWLRKKIIEKAIYTLPDTTTLAHKARKVIENSNRNVFDQHLNLMCLGFKADELVQLVKTDYCDNNPLEFIKDIYQSQKSCGELSHTLYTDFKVVLEGDMLPKVDRASMLNSLETRVPMLHKDVIELAAKIPEKFKINGRQKKIILRETFKDLIPTDIYHAKKKGFAVPLEKWFHINFRNELIELFNKNTIEEQGIFNHEYIVKILDEHFSFSKDRSSEIWTLYVFQKWQKGYFDNIGC